MPEYDVFIISENDSVEVDIPDIYKDDDSETEVDQIKNYLVEKYGIDFFALKTRIKRKERMIKVTTSIEIIDGDKIYFDVDKDYIKQKGIVFNLKTGFSSVGESYYKSNNITYSEKSLNKVIEYELMYKQTVDIIINKIIEISNLITDDKSSITSLTINRFNPNFYNRLPMKTFNLCNNNYVFFGSFNENNDMCGFGILYNLDLNIYYEGIFVGLNIFNALRLNLNTFPTLTKCNVFYRLIPNGIGEKNFLLNSEIMRGNIDNDNFYGKIYHSSKIGVYDGFYKNGTYNCYGKMTYKNGDIYYGYWKNGKRSVYGKMLYKTKEIYIGVWNEDLREDFGILLNKSHNKSYVGSFKNNEPTYNDNEFVILNKEIHNSATIIGEVEKCIKKNDDEYLVVFGASIFDKSDLKRNHFVNKKMGDISDNRQAYYIGQFNKEHIEDGFGRLFFNSDSKIIDSETFNLFSSDKHISDIYNGFTEYQCMFKNGKPNGFGIVKFSDGKKYIGNLKNGFFHGNGVFINGNGTILKGKWHDGKLRNDLIY